jgi:hypothetical protein
MDLSLPELQEAGAFFSKDLVTIRDFKASQSLHNEIRRS